MRPQNYARLDDLPLAPLAPRRSSNILSGLFAPSRPASLSIPPTRCYKMCAFATTHPTNSPGMPGVQHAKPRQRPNRPRPARPRKTNPTPPSHSGLASTDLAEVRTHDFIRALTLSRSPRFLRALCVFPASPTRCIKLHQNAAQFTRKPRFGLPTLTPRFLQHSFFLDSPATWPPGVPIPPTHANTC